MSPVRLRHWALLATLTVSWLAREAACQAPDPGAGAAKAAPVKQSLFDGRTLKPWRILDRIDFEKHGKIEVRDGAIQVAAGQPASGIAFRGKPPRVNYELSLEARRTAGGDFFCGLTFPYRQDYCTLILGGWGGRTIGLSNVDDEPAIENETASFQEFKQNQWYRVRLRVTEPRIQAWIDDEQVIDLATEGKKFSIWWEQEPARPLGIASWYTAAQWRKLTLTRLPAAARAAGDEPAQDSKR